MQVGLSQALKITNTQSQDRYFEEGDYLRLAAAALGLAEAIAKSSKIVGDVRRNFNELISNLSKQE